MASKKSEIIDALKAKLDELTEIKFSSYDKIYITFDDFLDYQLPAIQVYDVGEANVHVRSLLEVDWSLSLEVVMKQDADGTVDQKALHDLVDTIKRKMFEDPNLGVSGVKHLLYDTTITDLHTLAPYYYARMDFRVQFVEQLRPC